MITETDILEKTWEVIAQIYCRFGIQYDEKNIDIVEAFAKVLDPYIRARE